MSQAFAALRTKLGIPADYEAQPEPAVEGPIWASCPGSSGTVCEGMLRLVERDGPIWLARCDHCDAEAGVPARFVDPDIGKRARLEAVGLPERFRGVRFVEDPDNREALGAVRAWLASADRDPKKRVASLLPAPALYGNLGTGKSHLLAAACARLAADLGLRVLYRPARTLLRELQRFEFPVERDRAWEQAVSVDVLALDDLGAPRSTEWSLDVLADLLDERYSRQRPVMVATNYPPEGWDVFDARSRSRLRGMTFAVELRGSDRRAVAETISQREVGS